MPNDSKDSSKKNDALSLIVVMLACYCFALGPIAYVFAVLENRFKLDLGPADGVVEVVFYPHKVVYGHAPVYENYLDWWWELGGG